MALLVQGQFWTIPNILSLSRLALIPVWWILMSSPDRTLWWWGGAIVVYAILSDIADGLLARRFGMSSEWGKLLDPVGDKIAAGVAAIFCVIHRDMPLMALLLTVGRDLTLVVAGWYAMKRDLPVPTSLDIGRYAALLWGVTILLYTFDWQPYAGYFVWPAVMLYIAAGIAYVAKRHALITTDSPKDTTSMDS